jgi:hypothetical protein
VLSRSGKRYSSPLASIPDIRNAHKAYIDAVTALVSVASNDPGAGKGSMHFFSWQYQGLPSDGPVTRLAVETKVLQLAEGLSQVSPAMTIAVLVDLHRREQQYVTMAELGDCVRQISAQVVDAHAEVLEFLCPGGDGRMLLVGPEAPQVQDASPGAAPLAGAGAPSDGIIVNPGSVERLFEDSKAGMWTLPHLLSLREERREFPSMQSLALGVKAKHAMCLVDQKDTLRMLADPKKGVFARQADGQYPEVNIDDVNTMFQLAPPAVSVVGCLRRLMAQTRPVAENMTKLLRKAQNMDFWIEPDNAIDDSPAKADAHERELTLAFLSDPRHCGLFGGIGTINLVNVTKGDVDRIFGEGGLGMGTLSHLRSLDSKGIRFNSIGDAVAGLQALKADKERVLAYLNQPSMKREAVDPDLLDGLYWQAKAGLSTMSHLRSLELDTPSGGRKYSRFDDLVDAVADLETRERVFFYLSGPECSFFTQAPQPVPITLERVDGLLGQTGAGRVTVGHLKELDRVGAKFDSLEELIVELQAKQKESLVALEDVYSYLHGFGRSLLEGQAGVAVVPAEVTELLTESGAGISCKGYLVKLTRQGAHFESMAELTGAVRTEHAGSLADRKKALAYVLQPVHGRLLAKGVRAGVGLADIDHMFEAAESGPATLGYLKGLDRSGFEARSVGALISAVEGAHEQEQSDLAEVRSLLEKGVLLAPSAGAGRALGADAEHLFREANAGALTVHHLKMLEADGKQYHSIGEVRV